MEVTELCVIYVNFSLILNLWRATLPKSLNRTPVCHDFAPEMQSFDLILERKYFVGEGEGRGRWEYSENTRIGGQSNGLGLNRSKH